MATPLFSLVIYHLPDCGHHSIIRWQGRSPLSPDSEAPTAITHLMNTTSFILPWGLLFVGVRVEQMMMMERCANVSFSSDFVRYRSGCFTEPCGCAIGHILYRTPYSPCSTFLYVIFLTRRRECFIMRNGSRTSVDVQRSNADFYLVATYAQKRIPIIILTETITVEIIVVSCYLLLAV